MPSTRTAEHAARQLGRLAELNGLPPEQFTPEQLEVVFRAASKPATDEVQVKAAVLLSRLYPHKAPTDPAFALRTHTVLLRDLRQPRATLSHPSCNWLVMTHLRDENLAHIPWQSAAEVAAAAECFYGFAGGGEHSEDSHRRIRDLVKYAGRQFAKEGRWEEAFRLLEQVPVPNSVMDADLFWLRNSLVIYERRRVKRLRRWLAAFLGFAIVFVFLIAPWSFVQLENDRRAAAGLAALGPLEAVYWSVATAATVGYGDITPLTKSGRVLSMVNAIIGVTLTGVVAGLILGRVTPRQLP
jgi:hypothetical protein